MPIEAAALTKLVLLALLVALTPLAWWWVRQRGAALHTRLAALTLLMLFLTFDLIVFGAFTRLTDAGLGCPDWPGCYGQAHPFDAHADIHAAQSALPSGPVTAIKAWIEMIHRYLAMTLGLLILIAAAIAWRLRRSLPHSPWWATLTLAWVIAQGLFGKYTVTLKLYPAIVTLHLLGGMVLLALLVLQHESFCDRPLAMAAPGGTAGRDGSLRGAARPMASLRGAARPMASLRGAARPMASLRGAVAIVLVLVAAQLALGGWVSTNYAVLACRGFPTCNGQWLPAMDPVQGFTVLRELGRTADGGWLPFEALVAIHWAHRGFAVVAVAALALLARRLWRESDSAARRYALALAALALLQVGSGLTNVVLDWPLAAALTHTAGAAAIVALLASLWARARLAVPAAERALPALATTAPRSASNAAPR